MFTRCGILHHVKLPTILRGLLVWSPWGIGNLHHRTTGFQEHMPGRSLQSSTLSNDQKKERNLRISAHMRQIENQIVRNWSKLGQFHKSSIDPERRGVMRYPGETEIARWCGSSKWHGFGIGYEELWRDIEM